MSHLPEDARGDGAPWYPQEMSEEPCPLNEWPDVPSSYVVCADDRTVRPEWFRRDARERLGVEPIELPGGHCPHISRPAALADVLSDVAGLDYSPKNNASSR